MSAKCRYIDNNSPGTFINSGFYSSAGKSQRLVCDCEVTASCATFCTQKDKYMNEQNKNGVGEMMWWWWWWWRRWCWLSFCYYCFILTKYVVFISIIYVETLKTTMIMVIIKKYNDNNSRRKSCKLNTKEESKNKKKTKKEEPAVSWLWKIRKLTEELCVG